MGGGCLSVTHTHAGLMATFPSQPGLAGRHLDLPSPYVTLLVHLVETGQNVLSFLTQSYQVVFRCLPRSFVNLCCLQFNVWPNPSGLRFIHPSCPLGMTGGRQHYVGQLLLNLDLFVCPLFATLVTTKITGRKYIFLQQWTLKAQCISSAIKSVKIKDAKIIQWT